MLLQLLPVTVIGVPGGPKLGDIVPKRAYASSKLATKSNEKSEMTSKNNDNTGVFLPDHNAPFIYA